MYIHKYITKPNRNYFQQVLNGFLAKHVLLFPYTSVKNECTVISKAICL